MIRRELEAYEQLILDGGGSWITSGGDPLQMVGQEPIIIPPQAEAFSPIPPSVQPFIPSPEVIPASVIPPVQAVVDAVPSNTTLVIQSPADVITPSATIVVQNKQEILPLRTSIFAEGFGAYLSDILPNDIAIGCGAFSTAMRQIRNVQSIPIEKFAQVVTNMETTKGLDLIGGTDVPVNVNLAISGASLVALGSGPDGTYTDSDFFGAMSGLPYPWKDIQTNINLLQTSTLANIYKQLYLAVTWERATVSVQYTSYDDGFGTTYYHVTGVTLTDPGGGYGREGAAAPAITISNGGSGTTTIGTDDTVLNPTVTGFGNFGRVTSVALSSSGSDSTSIPTATVAYPPGGSSFPNSVVDTYIAAANAEISNIYNGNVNAAKKLNLLWKMVGTQLRIEQRARVTGLPPVPVPQDIYLAQFPTSTMAFVDTIPQFALNTLPHMYSQTLEAISDWQTPGGQSVVGMMRQERNKTKLIQAGVELDNNIPGDMTPRTLKILLANGTVSVAETGAGVPIGEATFTPPATLAQVDDNNNTIVPSPIGVYNNELDAIVVPERFVNSDVLGTLPALETAPQVVQPGDDEAGFTPIVTLATGDVGLGPNVQNPSLINPVAGTGKIPSGVTTPLDTGKPNTTGSLAGSKYQSVIPAPLQVAFISSTLTPSTYNVADAIDKVIECNCDCWIS
jgi:hypothetical protein